jgi:hypothetical protein
MLLGHPRMEELVLIDDGSYGFSVRDAVANIRRLAPKLRISAFELDTQKLRHLPSGGAFDLIHVDGDHTYLGALHDLSLVFPALSPRGLLVFDDVDHISRCMRAARAFHALHPELHSVYNPTHRGHILFGHPDAGIKNGRAHAMKKKSAGTDKKRKKPITTRREFFRSAGRGTLVIGGVALFGAGATASQMGCSGSGDGGGGTGNAYGGGGGTNTGGAGAVGPGLR